MIPGSMRIGCAMVVFLMVGGPLHAMVLPEKTEPFEPGRYIAYKLDAGQSIEVDGRLDESAWEEVPWTEPFGDVFGEGGAPPHLDTRVKVRWDDEHLYVAARMEEPNVRATLTERNVRTWRDNNFELFLDPNKDNQDYYEFSLNANEAIYDVFWDTPFESRRSLEIVRNWNLPGLEAAVHIEGVLNDASEPDEYWSVEVALPWRSIEPFAHRPAPPEDGDQWRMDFVRVQHPEEGRSHNWTWTPQWARNNHLPDRWGLVQFSTAAPGEASFESDPSVPVRYALQEIFYAQKRYHRHEHGTWADSLEELDYRVYEHPRIVAGPEMERTSCGFVVTAELETPEGQRQVWRIREDWRIWMEEAD